VVLETVNPCSLWALASFHIDFTHVRPMHPEGMRFLLESLGFAAVEVRYSAPVPLSLQIPDVPDRPGFGEGRFFNDAIRRLNGFVYGPRDYAVVGRKIGTDLL
jgi:O-antigen chain-terminating methyltransferase